MGAWKYVHELNPDGQAEMMLQSRQIQFIDRSQSVNLKSSQKRNDSSNSNLSRQKTLMFPEDRRDRF